MQLSFIALIPLYFLVKLLDILPEANEKKGFLETFFEIILHIIILIIGIVIIVKFSMYFKPLSGIPYPEDFAFMPIILVSLFIGITYQTKLSEKIFTLKEKIMNKVKPEKPAPTQNYALSHSLQTMPPQPQPETQPPPNYNQMYQQQPVNTFEPYAANEASGSFGTSF
jgi:general stress protein CsbA